MEMQIKSWFPTLSWSNIIWWRWKTGALCLFCTRREWSGVGQCTGNVYFGVANGTACTMHSLAWDDPEDKEDAHNAKRTSTPGQVINSPKPPNHIIVDIKPVMGIKWPQGLNLSPNSNLIPIPIGLTSRCEKKLKLEHKNQWPTMPIQ